MHSISIGSYQNGVRTQKGQEEVSTVILTKCWRMRILNPIVIFQQVLGGQQLSYTVRKIGLDRRGQMGFVRELGEKQAELFLPRIGQRGTKGGVSESGRPMRGVEGEDPHRVRWSGICSYYPFWHPPVYFRIPSG
jgi:hypothetical protein